MILFRADGNSIIGMGHIMRCLSIADAFKSLGEESVFSVADASMQNLIEERGFKVHVLDTDFSKMSDDTEKIEKLINETKAHLLIVDSYYVTPDYLSSLRSMIKLIYIDDLAAFAYPADVIINYNIYGNKSVYEKLYSGSSVRLPELLIGTEYVPLRREFHDLPPKEIKEKCTDILISTGGADPVHMALKIAGHISSEYYDDGLRYHLVIGAMNHDKEAIERIASEYKSIALHCNVKDMSRLIRSCDIALSAAGSTLYEICACGVPLITYILADNQISGAEEFERRGLAVNLGDIRGLSDVSCCIDAIKELCGSKEKRAMLRDKMSGSVDGKGAERIALYLSGN